MKILLIDNYDSFTFNIVHALQKNKNIVVDVFRNNEITLAKANDYSKIVISPGPGLPADSGISCSIIKKYAATKSILGICLGHQAIASVFGASLFNMPHVIHGKATDTFITDTTDPLFKNIPNQIKTARYHSWMVTSIGLPDCFKIIAVDEQDRIMALSHIEYNLKGIQFHPESILTPHGQAIIDNWIAL